MRFRIKRRFAFKFVFMVWAGCLVGSLWCNFLFSAQEDAQEKKLKDGLYTESNSKIEITVAIEDGKITAINILSHRAADKYTEMLKPLVEKIIKKQSTEVDAVSGATVSSKALIKAVNDALSEASMGVVGKIRAVDEDIYREGKWE